MFAVPPDFKTSLRCSRSGEWKATLAGTAFLRGGEDGTLVISRRNCRLTGTWDDASDGASDDGASDDETVDELTAALERTFSFTEGAESNSGCECVLNRS